MMMQYLQMTSTGTVLRYDFLPTVLLNDRYYKYTCKWILMSTKQNYFSPSPCFTILGSIFKLQSLISIRCNTQLQTKQV